MHSSSPEQANVKFEKRLNFELQQAEQKVAQTMKAQSPPPLGCEPNLPKQQGTDLAWRPPGRSVMVDLWAGYLGSAIILQALRVHAGPGVGDRGHENRG